MQQSLFPGCLEVICGSMFSGKTEELLRRIKRAQIARQKVQVFKPVLDDRFGRNHVQSHDASRVQALPVQKAFHILEAVDENTRVVAIDEVQFFDPGIIDVVEKLAFRGKRVIVAGLDMDYRGVPFGPVPQLLAVAESVTKLNAVCVVCGQVASRTQRVSSEGGVTSKEQILVGAGERYEPRCRMCHEPQGAGK